MAKGINSNIRIVHKTKRKGIHSKNNSSLNKRSKTYKKRYRGQGK